MYLDIATRRSVLARANPAPKAEGERVPWGFGRFMEPDPIGYESGMNLYAYVLNDPINFTDPSGLQENCPGCGGDIVVVGPRRSPARVLQGVGGTFTPRGVSETGDGGPGGYPEDPNPDPRRDGCGNPLPVNSRRYSIPPGYRANPVDPNHIQVINRRGQNVMSPYWNAARARSGVGVNWSGVASDLGQLAAEVGTSLLTGLGLRWLFGVESGGAIQAANRVDVSAGDAARNPGGPCSR